MNNILHIDIFKLLRLWCTYFAYAKYTEAHRTNDRVCANDEVTEFGVPFLSLLSLFVAYVHCTVFIVFIVFAIFTSAAMTNR